MTGLVTAAAIADLCRAPTTTPQEAADLIQHYAELYAATEVERAIQRFDARLQAALEGAIVSRRPS